MITRVAHYRWQVAAGVGAGLTGVVCGPFIRAMLGVAS